MHSHYALAVLVLTADVTQRCRYKHELQVVTVTSATSNHYHVSVVCANRAISIPIDAQPTYTQLAHHPTNPVQHGYNAAGSVLPHVNLCVTDVGLGNAVSMYKNAHSIISIGTNDSCMA